MRKSLFAIGLLAITSVQAQNVLVHVDDAATTYVSKGTLVYSGGGLQMKGNGIVENHGNFMVTGSATDSFRTIDASDVDKTESNGGGNFINKLNEPGAYATYNVNDPLVAPAYTYGQLFISNIPQANLTGIVDQEFKAINHGSYQQIGLPFYDKSASTLSTELGKTFSNVRYSQNEILSANNTNIVSVNFPTWSKLGSALPGYTYYMLGGSGLDLSTTTRTLKGRPLTDIGTSVTLQGAAAAVNFGTNGNATNQYNEKYYTYVQDEFVTTPWQGTYGRYMYQFANPFLTNLDLSQIAVNEANGDGVNLTTIQGVRLEVSPNAVQTTTGGTTAVGSSAYKFVTFASGAPTGDVDYMSVRPMGTFVIKLNSDAATDQLNFANLRRFNYYTRDAGTAYNVAANKNTAGNGSVKQLAVIGLDNNGNEIARTYYVVYPAGTTGHSATQAKTQVKADTSDLLGTYEEALAGGYDTNYTNQYWLYINEANENTFQGKNIKLVNYDLAKVKSYKFEIRENAQLVSNGTHALSSGIGFYYKAANGTVQQAIQGAVVPVAGTEYDLYYGEPSNVVLAASESKSPSSRTVVVYNPGIENYIVRFDPNWKKADIEVYDMSGKLVISKKAVAASTDFVIELDGKIKNSYVVKVVSDKGEVVNTKILR
ncbi:hypothetical protein ASG22_17020 [Chryseobacterium sp. Leaf405]|uniref:T9SS type A sorting domain-containing protein n=1 Tax=Chryseobacterium sp. Leaf405 TaxID=1736367 RepID=UPI0006F552BB|nr:T9SS type A sorting domain-containing protein [Chryseobacterium sp. Leaf405]KQT20676.1 hypothetical protein ASG22_17020 [Chryseobacterium sp. Leaf405]